MKRARSSTDFAGLIESGKRMATGRGSAGSAQVLFAVPVESSGGEVVCTQPAKQVYLVTWTSGPDNRLTSVRSSSRRCVHLKTNACGVVSPFAKP